jgi:hypothetical protein
MYFSLIDFNTCSLRDVLGKAVTSFEHSISGLSLAFGRTLEQKIRSPSHYLTMLYNAKTMLSKCERRYQQQLSDCII